MAEETLDVIVVGAGVFGIAAAGFYLDVHPQCKLRIVDRDNGVGGVWNARRNYATFWSQIGYGMAEFSDLPMTRPPEDEMTNDFFEASRVTEYMEQYLEKHVHNGQSMKDRLVLHYDVHHVTKEGHEWVIDGTQLLSGGKVGRKMRARKVIIATGLTSQPQLPTFPNQEDYKGQIIHQVDFGASGVLDNPKMQHVTVIGGAKSAADMVYACIKAGKTVTWLIRASGAGPAAFVGGEGKGSYKNSPELGATRWMATMSPSIYQPNTYWTYFINKTSLGQKLANGFWSIATGVSRAIFDSNIEARDGFQNLKPSVDVFWSNDTLGLIQFADFWPVVAKNADIYRSDITSLREGSIVLTTGHEIKADAILCGTGWRREYPFFTSQQADELGIPRSIEDEKTTSTDWEILEKQADTEILEAYPKLAHPPDNFIKKSTHSTPFRLYRLIAPITSEEQADRSIAFMGCAATPNAFRPAEAQAIWTTAYLDGKLKLEGTSELRKAVARMLAWNKRRYLNNGRLGNHLHYDMVAYTDVLMEDLGLHRHIDSKTSWQYWTQPCFARDMKDVRVEYKAKYGTDEDPATAKIG